MTQSIKTLIEPGSAKDVLPCCGGRITLGHIRGCPLHPDEVDRRIAALKSREAQT